MRHGPTRTTAFFLPLAVLASLAAPAPLRAQAGDQAKTKPAPETEKGPQTPTALDNVRTIWKQLVDLDAQITAKQRTLDGAPAEKKEALAKELAGLKKERQELQRSFEQLAAGVDVAQFSEEPPKEVNVEKELTTLLAPLISELKTMTEKSRKVERLRIEIGRLEERLPVAERTAATLSALAGEAKDPALAASLTALSEAWGRRQTKTKNRLTVANLQLQDFEKDKKPFLESSREVIGGFFRSRGRNLILAVLAFAVVFLGLRVVHGAVRSVSPAHRTPDKIFVARLIDVAFYGITAVGAIGALLAVLYASGDWVLLSIAAIVMVAAAWTAREGLPKVWRQMMFLMNLGTVREGERLVYDGVPWKVTKLHLSSVLENPALEGCRIRMPIASLFDLHSRPCVAGEPWFPSQRGDWVVLGDGTFGKVESQTHEFVQLGTAGSRKTYATGSFLGANPQNLSNGFRVTSTFGVGYVHQDLSTTKIPETFQTVLTERLAKEGFGEHLAGLAVVLCSAGASSLDYIVLADFRGGAAPSWPAIPAAIQGHLVDICTESSWDIPYNQIVVHSAG